MIWFRRILAIFWSFGFLTYFLTAALVLRINSTFLEPSFVKDELRKADLFNFAYDVALPAALEEGLADWGDLPWGIALTTQDIVDGLRKAVPPPWLQGQAEAAIDQVWPYMTGSTQSFEVAVPLTERGEAAVPVVKDSLRQSGIYHLATNEDFITDLDKQLKDFGELPFGLTPSGRQVASALGRIAPPEWLQQQVEAAIDETAPYFTGRKDSFEVIVPLADRAEVAVPVVKDLLRELDAYNLILQGIEAKVVEENIGQLAKLPAGITITSDEIATALRQVAPVAWVQERVERILDQLTPYITGKSTTFQISLPLSDRIKAAERIINDLADRKLEQLYNSLPPCTPAQALELSRGIPSGQLPACRPTALSLEEIKGMANIDISAQVSRAITDLLPPVWTFTDADLRRLLSSEDAQRLEDALKIVRQGWTYTDADLRQDLGAGVSNLDKVRQAMRDGWTFTDADLKEALLSGSDPKAVDVLDQARLWLGRIRQFDFLLYIGGILSLASIGSAAGRRWSTKLAWAAGVLGAVALTTYLGLGIVYSDIIVPNLDAAQAKVQAAGTQLLMVEKGFSVAKTVIWDFIAGIRSQSLMFLGIALLALGLSLAWGRLSRTRK